MYIYLYFFKPAALDEQPMFLLRNMTLLRRLLLMSNPMYINKNGKSVIVRVVVDNYSSSVL